MAQLTAANLVSQCRCSFGSSLSLRVPDRDLEEDTRRRSLLFREQPFIEGCSGNTSARNPRRSLLFREQPFIEGVAGDQAWREAVEVAALSGAAFH